MSRRPSRVGPQGDVVFQDAVVRSSSGDSSPPISLAVNRGEAVALIDPEGSTGGELLWAVGGMSALVSGTLSIFGAPARSDDARSVVGVASPRFQFVSGLSLLDHLRLAVPGPLLAEASGRLSRVRDVLPPFDVSVASGDELVADPRGRLLWSLALGVAMGAKLLGIDLADEGLSSFDSALMEFVRKEREVGTVLLLALRQDSPLLPHLDRSAVRKDDRWRVLPTR